MGLVEVFLVWNVVALEDGASVYVRLQGTVVKKVAWAR